MTAPFFFEGETAGLMFVGHRYPQSLKASAKNQATSQCSLQSARLVLTEQLRSGSPARFILEIDIRKLLAAVVPHHEAGRLLLDRPGWREAASDH
jgi:hypothetical protein